MKKNVKEQVKKVSGKAISGVNKVKKIKMIDEFRTFIARGNVLDLAVGVIIGAAFQSLVTSLTNNIISPIILVNKLLKAYFRQLASVMKILSFPFHPPSFFLSLTSNQAYK